MKRSPMKRSKVPMCRGRTQVIAHKPPMWQTAGATLLASAIEDKAPSDTEFERLREHTPARVIRMRLTFAPQPKREYVRSTELREAYRLIPCQHCNRSGPDDGVCCAHSNWGVHGKGGHIKADDSRGAALCSHCHVPILDQGSHLSRAERQAMWWQAHVRSVRLLTARGLWPKGVPVPDIEHNPFELECTE